MFAEVALSVVLSQAVAGDAAAIRELRAMGQPGVDALLIVREESPAFHSAIDQVCKQRDCAWSGLYWHTDLAEAKRVAQESGRPILSLRLLGNLDEELSCANSRFFRTLLYPNRAISAYLREHYVLHWQSVRAAPVITIDFGDGRTMERTITGNSIHYVLDASGRPLDAIPGLYGPDAFLAQLREGVSLHRAIAKLPERRRAQALRNYHQMAAGGVPAAETEAERTRRLGVWSSGALALTKAIVEAPTLDRTSFQVDGTRLGDDVLEAMRDAQRARIDDNARALIRAKRANAPANMRTEEAFAAMFEQLEHSVGADTKQNEQLHATLHQWLATDAVEDVEALNARVYKELFLAPNDDPWMGLIAETSFTGISGEGLRGPAAPAAPARPGRR